MTRRGAILPDIGGILGGLQHPLEKEIRRKELPGFVPGRKPRRSGSRIDSSETGLA